MKFNFLKNKEKNANLNLAINERTREKSRGRSMVEMLGVLAIIGVLSISAISGYTIAMRRYRANEIINTASKYATLVWTDINNEMINNPQKYFWLGGFHEDYYLYNLPSDYLEHGRDTGYTLLEKSTIPGIQDSIPDYPFSNMGLGPLPSGTLEMELQYISATKSGILITIYIKFNSPELCNSVKSQFDYDPYVWGQSDTCAENQTFGIGFQQS